MRGFVLTVLVLLPAACTRAGFGPADRAARLEASSDTRSDTRRLDATRPDAPLVIRDSGTTLTSVLVSTRDTMLDLAGAEINYGSCSTAFVQNNAPGSTAEHYRALFFFDLIGISPKCRVDSAVLTLYLQSSPSSPTQVSVHRLTEDWSEGTGGCGPLTIGFASWHMRSAGVPWSVDGGTFDPVAASTTQVVPSATSTSWNVTGLAQAWVSGAQPNRGVLLETAFSSSGDNYISWFTREEAKQAGRPQLTVSYTCGTRELD